MIRSGSRRWGAIGAALATTVASALALAPVDRWHADGPAVAAPAAQDVVSVQYPTVELPLLGQTDLAVYVPSTGHTVSGLMLDYWRANGATSVYGDPISEPFVDDEGYWSQAFENGIFRYLPEEVWTADPFIRLRPIAERLLSDRVDTFRADGRRGAGGGDRRDASWRSLNPNGKTVQRVVES